MDPRVANQVSIADLFDQFIEASTMKNVLSLHHRILNYSDLDPGEFNVFFPKLKRAVMTNRVRKNWKAIALFSKIDKKAAHRCYSNTKTPTSNSDQRLSSDIYQQQEVFDDNLSSQQSPTRSYYNNNALQHYNCLVIGSGPAGLRTAIELQLLGASKVVVVEKRSRFSRNNVLHLWPFVIDDLKSLGAKKFYGKFCAGSIDHISIRQLQLILLKICLMIGCDFRDSCSFLYLCPSSIKQPTQQQPNISTLRDETNGDIMKANGSSDSRESTINCSKCDLEDESSESKGDEFIRVSSLLVSESVTKQDYEKRDEDDENILEVDSSSIDSNIKSKHDDYSKLNGEHCSTSNPNNSNDVSAQNSTSERTSTTKLERTDNTKSETSPVQELNNFSRKAINLHGSRAHFQSEYKLQEKELHSYEWDVIIGADGRRSTLSKFFPLKEFRGRLAIAITANFINRQTPAEASVSEISGLSFIYNQDMFNALAYDTNILLENICYYKDDTHYFVMTAKKKSLLERGVLLNDYAATHDLLSDGNVNRKALLKYAKDAAYWTTGLEPLDFALNHYGQEDCAMFDFTSMYAAANACKAICTKKGGLTLVSLAGDSLLEPFWPTGSGCARGFLSSFDAAWMCRQWAVNKCAVVDYHPSTSSKSSRNHNRPLTPNNHLDCQTNIKSPNQSTPTFNRLALSVMAERESIYRILAQTTSENLQQNYSHWTLNPHSRYPNLNRHLVTPSQVEHLITNNGIASSFIKFGVRSNAGQQLSIKTSLTESRSRRVKSPNNNNSGLRKSPKKLKSADASPVAQQKSAKGCHLKPGARKEYRSLSRNDITIDDTFLEFEKSYNKLSEDAKAHSYYLNHRFNSNNYDDNVSFEEFLSNPSISGIMPSSNNLLTIEARRARDIDECLRQRRQKNQLSTVRDHLIEQFKGHGINGVARRNSTSEAVGVPGGAVLFNELRRLREQQSKGKENYGSRVGKDANGQLTLLNSIRRCTSFAERVKSFENKLGPQSSQESSVPTTPRTPIDDVKNLPQFATLQEIFVNSKSQTSEKKSTKIPIMKLSKDDWNVKCWEKRIASFKQHGRDFAGSTKSLNKAFSMDSYYSDKPEKQVEVFKSRIKEMADKLKKTKGTEQKSQTKLNKLDLESAQQQQKPAQGWVSHVRRKLINGSDTKNPQTVVNQHMNPSVPSRQIKKLFADDDDEDDESDKHYDHLCINRPVNRYLSKNAYTSHLSRVKYDSATSKVINNQTIKQAYLTSQQQQLPQQQIKSTNLDDDDYSKAINFDSSFNRSRVGIETKCSRCRSLVETSQSISVSGSTLHKNCLRCAECGITLRTNELQHYLNLSNKNENDIEASYKCAICKPSIRDEMNLEADERLKRSENTKSSADDTASASQIGKTRMRSREEFFNEKINYNEIYKNILDDNMRTNKLVTSKIDRIGLSSSRETTPSNATEKSPSRKSSSSLEYDDARSRFGNPGSSLNTFSDLDHERVKESPSPITITLPLDSRTVKVGDEHELKDYLDSVETDGKSDIKEPSGFKIARSETVDGSEQVTLILPSSTDNSNRHMIDEEELERILHLDTQSSSRDRSTSAHNKFIDDGDDNEEANNSGEDDSSDDSKNHEQGDELSDDPSSLNSPPDVDEYDEEDDDGDEDDDDEDDEADQNSTYEDFLTSEEFGAVSDREETAEPEEPASAAEIVNVNE